jgi:methylated-DNA-[protein]-cysteine S-methyltransferase
MTQIYSYFDSPIGPLLLSGDGVSLCGLHFSTGKMARGADPGWRRADNAFGGIKRQLEEYFGGQRKQFDIEMIMAGTPFQQSVWQALQEIPYGETASYADIAARIGNPKAVRAVGAANGCNPIAIVVPCHRVIGSNGSLTGFGGGLDTKQYLLQLEANHSGLWA